MNALPIVDSADALRVRPIPRAEPRAALRVVPEDRVRVPSSQGVLPLTLPEGRWADDDGSDRDDRRAATEEGLPPVAAWAHLFLQAALEAASGRRPMAQLVRWTTEDVYAVVNRRAMLSARLEPRGGTTRVRSVRVCRPVVGIVEVSAVVLDRGRVRAVAARLESTRGRWRASALEIG